MRVLLDTCVWGGVLPELIAFGHDAAWVGSLPEDPGDEAILARAFNERRVLVTLDKDFGELAILHRREHAGIVRLVDIAARQQGQYCHEALLRFANELAEGAIVTAEPARYRVRPGPFDLL